MYSEQYFKQIIQPEMDNLIKIKELIENQGFKVIFTLSPYSDIMKDKKVKKFLNPILWEFLCNFEEQIREANDKISDFEGEIRKKQEEQKDQCIDTIVSHLEHYVPILYEGGQSLTDITLILKELLISRARLDPNIEQYLENFSEQTVTEMTRSEIIRHLTSGIKFIFMCYKTDYQ